ncbi:MAG: hypothetical protein GY854_33390 [Deltaproteobacteria bacterium]|nr:hypothetical protein [Deltaproteobacteria bacterium]
MTRLSALLIGALILAVSSVSTAEQASGVISPTSSSPVEVKPGGLVQVFVRLRLHLTPPPGVQQPAARKGWRAELIARDAVAPRGETGIVTYPATVIRIRPTTEGTYRVSIGLVPWILPGLYDLRVIGPGFFDEQPSAVAVGGIPAIGSTGSIDETRLVRIGDDTIEIRNTGPGPARFAFKLIVSANLPGLAVRFADGTREPIHPDAVSWAEPDDGKGARRKVLHCAVVVPGADAEGPGRRIVRWSPVDATPCRAHVSWRGDKVGIDPMEWTDLEMIIDGFNPVTVIWNFGDGESSVGRKTRHRFMLVKTAAVEVTAFDAHGRECRASAAARINLPLERNRCNCRTIGVRGAEQSGLFEKLRFFLFPTAFGE